MNILFITSNRLGDGVLSSGLLNYIEQQHPDAQVTIVCGDLPSTLFTGYPLLKELVVLRKEKYNLHWVKLWQRLAGRKWDMVVDLRDSAVSRLLRAGTRYIYSSSVERKGHKVEQCAAVMRLAHTPDPKIWTTLAQENEADKFIPHDGGLVLGVGPTSNWIGKTWPAESFVELVSRLSAPGGLMPGVKVAVFGARGEEEGAYKVYDSIPENRRINIIAKTDPGTVATCLKRCSLYIGNDSGLMHTSAAAGTPTLGLFDPGWPDIYRPWGEKCAYVRTAQTVDELTDFPGYDPKTLDRSLMTSLSVDDVYAACAGLMARVGLSSAA